MWDEKLIGHVCSTASVPTKPENRVQCWQTTFLNYVLLVIAACRQQACYSPPPFPQWAFFNQQPVYSEKAAFSSS